MQRGLEKIKERMQAKQDHNRINKQARQGIEVPKANPIQVPNVVKSGGQKTPTKSMIDSTATFFEDGLERFTNSYANYVELYERKKEAEDRQDLNKQYKIATQVINNVTRDVSIYKQKNPTATAKDVNSFIGTNLEEHFNHAKVVHPDVKSAVNKSVQYNAMLLQKAEDDKVETNEYLRAATLETEKEIDQVYKQKLSAKLAGQGKKDAKSDKELQNEALNLVEKGAKKLLGMPQGTIDSYHNNQGMAALRAGNINGAIGISDSEHLSPNARTALKKKITNDQEHKKNNAFIPAKTLRELESNRMRISRDADGNFTSMSTDAMLEAYNIASVKNGKDVLISEALVRKEKEFGAVAAENEQLISAVNYVQAMGYQAATNNISKGAKDRFDEMIETALVNGAKDSNQKQWLDTIIASSETIPAIQQRFEGIHRNALGGDGKATPYFKQLINELTSIYNIKEGSYKHTLSFVPEGEERSILNSALAALNSGAMDIDTIAQRVDNIGELPTLGRVYDKQDLTKIKKIQANIGDDYSNNPALNSLLLQQVKSGIAFNLPTKIIEKSVDDIVKSHYYIDDHIAIPRKQLDKIVQPLSQLTTVGSVEEAGDLVVNSIKYMLRDAANVKKLQAAGVKDAKDIVDPTLWVIGKSHDMDNFNFNFTEIQGIPYVSVSYRDYNRQIQLQYMPIQQAVTTYLLNDGQSQLRNGVTTKKLMQWGAEE